MASETASLLVLLPSPEPLPLSQPGPIRRAQPQGLGGVRRPGSVNGIRQPRAKRQVYDRNHSTVSVLDILAEVPVRMPSLAAQPGQTPRVVHPGPAGLLRMEASVSDRRPPMADPGWRWCRDAGALTLQASGPRGTCTSPRARHTMGSGEAEDHSTVLSGAKTLPCEIS